MTEIRWTPQAADDLQAVHDFIARDSERCAQAAQLPEGTVLNPVVDDEGDELGESERAALNDAISNAWASAQAGEGRPANEVVAALRKR